VRYLTLNEVLELHSEVISRSGGTPGILPFVDGNKHTGHAAMEVFLVLNGFEIRAPVDEQEQAESVAREKWGAAPRCSPLVEERR
jgi:prophage maintenance system killer protein